MPSWEGGPDKRLCVSEFVAETHTKKNESSSRSLITKGFKSRQHNLELDMETNKTNGDVTKIGVLTYILLGSGPIICLEHDALMEKQKTIKMSL